MKYTDTQLRVWDDRRLRVGRDKRDELLRQAKGLTEKLEKAIPESSPFKVVRFRRAGSLVKATALYPRADTGIDADIAVYLDVSGASDWDLATMHATLREIAISVYPTKSPDDFWQQPHTMGMEFRASGLKVDLVPLIAIEGDAEKGWMVDSYGQRAHLSDIPAHIKFVRDLARADSRYRPLVRMVKRWRNEAELNTAFGSFPIELILAQINADQDPATSLEEGLQRLFLYIAQWELKIPILSGHGSTPDPKAPVVILDPADGDNNVAAWVTDTQRAEIVGAAIAAWETLVLAARVGGKGETEGYWREVFGSDFTTEEAE
jgi:tRNA nucleotidyltransferase (CCA-adding enzyme)